MITINESLCTACGSCIRVCSADVFIERPGRVPDYTNQSACIHCSQCFCVCPMGAIALDGVEAPALPLIEDFPLSSEQETRLFKGCRSVRQYKPDFVDQDVLMSALEDARYAPTASNTQQIEWLLLQDPEQKKAIIEDVITWAHKLNLPQYAKRLAAHSEGRDLILRGAPQVIFAHTPDTPWSRVDAAIAASYLALSLHNRGIGSCWAGFVLMALVAGQVPSLKVPEGRKVHAGLMIGYADVHYNRVPVRKPVRLQII